MISAYLDIPSSQVEKLEYNPLNRIPASNNYKLIWSNLYFTLVPEVLFEEKQSQRLLSFQSQLPFDEYHIGFSTIPELELVIVYCRPKNINLDFINSREMHTLHPLLLSHFLDCKHSSGKRVYAHLQGSLLFLSAWEDGKLIFANGFPVHSEEDQAYFILYTMEQLDFSQHVPVHLSGDWPSKVENLNFYRYLDSIELWQSNLALQLPADMPSHALMELRTSYLCE